MSPNLFIIGAPKCGTTSLARWLGAHPHIFMSPIKEPHYYSTDLANRAVISQKRYRGLFRDAAHEHKAVGEASTWYLYSREAVTNIERQHPGARYIVMTRDPTAMAHSLYHHNVRVLHEDQATFENAWRLQAERAAGRCIPASCADGAFLQYEAACSLGSLLERLLTQVSLERVLQISLEEMTTDPRRQYRRVMAFLDVPDDGRTEFAATNEARGHRSRLLQHLVRLGGRAKATLGVERRFGLARFNERPQPKGELREDFQRELHEVFAEERQRLASLKEMMT